MRRSLGYVAMGLILVGGAILALSEERWQVDEPLTSVLSFLAPAEAHAAEQKQAAGSRNELAAYYDNSPSPNELKSASRPAPSTDSTSRRTQLDARFEDMSLSLEEDESNSFRQEMGPATTQAQQPRLHSNASRPGRAMPSELAPLPEEPEQGAFASDEESMPEPQAFASDSALLSDEPLLARMPQPATPKLTAAPTFSPATSEPALNADTRAAVVSETPEPAEASLPIAHEPTPAAIEPTMPLPVKQDRYAEFQATDVPTTAPVEPTPAASDEPAFATTSKPQAVSAAPALEPSPVPLDEPRRLTSFESPREPQVTATVEPQPAPAVAPRQTMAATTEVPSWQGNNAPTAMQQMFANTTPASTTSDKSGAGAVSVHWLTPGEVNRGDEIPCRLKVTNDSDSPAVSIAVHVQLPEHAELASATASAKPEGRVLSWQLDRLEPQESKTFEVRLLSKGEGDLAPTAAVTYTRAATASIHVLDPQLTVSIEGPEQALVSQPAVYQLRVSNPGTGKARNVIVQARLDARLSHPAGNELEYAIGTLGPGETRLLEVPVTGTTPGEVNIVAEATSANRLSAQGGCVVEIVRPSLELMLEGPKLRFVDRKAVFTLTAYNPSAVAATNVQLFGSVPAGYQYEGATAGGGFDEAAGAVAWFIGRLEPQGTAKVEYELIAHELGAHKVLAMVRADLGVEERTDLDTLIDGVPSVTLELAAPDAPIEVGGQAAYRIEVTNRGTKAATNVQVACRLPAEMESAEIRGATAGNVSGDRIVFEPLATLAPGETKVYEVHAHCSRAGDVRFRAFFRSEECRKVVQQETLTRIYQD
ncbi:MAG: DUF11 domain-containing protein [Pirellulales bacterium]|nr:DUF11 domain-containing protein [Pirellulales bacterium]